MKVSLLQQVRHQRSSGRVRAQSGGSFSNRSGTTTPLQSAGTWNAAWPPVHRTRLPSESNSQLSQPMDVRQDPRWVAQVRKKDRRALTIPIIDAKDRYHRHRRNTLR